MGVIDEIKDRLDAVEVIGATVKLRKSGKNYTGFCPFHPNTRTPAFVVFPESGTWRCFGACNEGGDIFSFLMKKENWDFAEALRFLAQKAGVELRPRTPEGQQAEEAYQRLRELLEAAIVFYRRSLLQSPDGREVLEYLHRRGLRDETLESFEIGYAPQSWDTTFNLLREKGFTRQEVAQAGMISEREDGTTHDRFRHRIMIPIRDASGKLAGFGARVVNPEDVPKFLNSPQTVLFDKGRLLYGLDKARKAIRVADQAVIVEGYLDVIALHQAGFTNSVSPMGTALTETQLRLVKRFSRHIVLALDADAAGAQATLRGLTLAREALDRQPDPVFDARGLVRYEGRLDADIRVVTLPTGQDPDEVVGKDAADWTALLGRASPVVEYVMEVLTAQGDVESAKTKGEIARQVLPLIEDVADAVEREAYRQALARRLRVDERALQGWHPRLERRQGAGRRGLGGGEEMPTQEVTGARDVLEPFCLGALLRTPELVYRIDRQLQAMELPRLSEEDFSAGSHRIIFQVLRQSLAQEEQEPAQYWRSHLEAPLLEEAEELQSQVAHFDPERPRELEAVMSSFLRLRKRSIEANLAHLQFQLQSAQEEVEDDVARSREMEGLTREVLRLGPQKDRLEGYTRHQ